MGYLPDLVIEKKVSSLVILIDCQRIISFGYDIWFYLFCKSFFLYFRYYSRQSTKLTKLGLNYITNSLKIEFKSNLALIKVLNFDFDCQSMLSY